jgi:hypothetical protein
VLYALSKRNVRRVIWLNVRENRPERRDVNNALDAATQRWGNLEIADWNDVSLAHTGVFLPDGHHLLPAGGRLMGSLMAQRLDSYAANKPRGPLPPYGLRMRTRPDVQGYGQIDDLNAGRAASGFVERSPLVGVAASVSGRGYWLARRNGVVKPFGDAPFRGSAAGLRLTQPIVGITATRTGNGYWLVAGDGGIFSFGDARFFGSTGAMRLNEPIVGMAAQPNGRGYWLVAYDGGLFTFGSARYFGSGATTPRYWKIVSMASTPRGHGYWMLAANGEVLTFGTARNSGWRPSLEVLFIGFAMRAGGGYWLAAQGPPA